MIEFKLVDSLSVLHSLSLRTCHTRLYTWSLQSRLGAESLLQTVEGRREESSPLLSTLPLPSPQMIPYCIVTFQRIDLLLSKAKYLYPQVISIRKCNPRRYKPFQRRRHKDFACSRISILGSLTESKLRYKGINYSRTVNKLSLES